MYNKKFVGILLSIALVINVCSMHAMMTAVQPDAEVPQAQAGQELQPDQKRADTTTTQISSTGLVVVSGQEGEMKGVVPFNVSPALMERLAELELERTKAQGVLVTMEAMKKSNVEMAKLIEKLKPAKKKTFAEELKDAAREAFLNGVKKVIVVPIFVGGVIVAVYVVMLTAPSLLFFASLTALGHIPLLGHAFFGLRYLIYGW